ncbi:hypothetical protein SLEP1_g52249 [Rubroshorea leprosula]|uniref:Uncharacterized protein n=1 Tax=Rubroshorea leprosula TaxID=152421 RepID=A0AAV5M7E6_9ROSI|nr:hypothetical protein SLEP1_g52249 [Rubroshorea leprosula]
MKGMGFVNTTASAVLVLVLPVVWHSLMAVIFVGNGLCGLHQWKAMGFVNTTASAVLVLVLPVVLALFDGSDLCGLRQWKAIRSSKGQGARGKVQGARGKVQGASDLYARRLTSNVQKRGYVLLTPQLFVLWQISPPTDFMHKLILNLIVGGKEALLQRMMLSIR